MRIIITALLILCAFHVVSQDASVTNLVKKAKKTSRNDLPTATLLIDSALRMVIPMQNDTLLANVLLEKARIESYNNEYKASLKHALQARTIYRKHKNNTALAPTLLVIGHNYSALGKFKQSNKSFLEALQIARKTNDFKTIAEAYNGLGNDAYSNSALKNALEFYKQSKVYFALLNDELYIADINNNIGNIYSDQQKYDQAKKAYREALTTYKAKNSNLYEVYIYYNLGEVYIKEIKYDSALYYMNLSLNLSLKTHHFETIYASYTGLKEINQKIGNYQEALKFSELAYAFEDSLKNSENDKYIAQLEVEFQKKVDQETIASQTKEILNQKQQSLIGYIGMGILVVLLFTLFFYYRRVRILNKRFALSNSEILLKNQLIDKALNEKEILLKEVHHRVKNSLQIISSLLNLQEMQLTDLNAIEALQESKLRIQSIALMHQNLYQHDADLGKVNVNSYLNDILELQQKAFSSTDKIVQCQLNATVSELDIDHSLPLGLIASEVINNAYKHAFIATEDPKITVNASTINGFFKLEISDNGSGISANQVEKKQSLGLEIVEALSQQLEGNFSLESLKGKTIFTLQFPI